MTRKLDRISCEETMRKLDDYMDRSLAPDDVVVLEQHLDECALCVTAFNFEGAVLEDLRRKLDRVRAPRDLMGRIRRELDKASEEEGG